jgi:hypothetical protein
MREIFKYGSVGGAPGNRCFYPELGLGKAVLVPRSGFPSRLARRTTAELIWRNRE